MLMIMNFLIFLLTKFLHLLFYLNYICILNVVMKKKKKHAFYFYVLKDMVNML